MSDKNETNAETTDNNAPKNVLTWENCGLATLPATQAPEPPEITDPVLLHLSQAGQAQLAKRNRRRGWSSPY